MTCHYEHNKKTIAIFGQTFPVKDQIKSLSPDGARFNGSEKCWEIKYSKENLKLVNDFCIHTGGGAMGDFKPEAASESVKRVMSALQNNQNTHENHETEPSEKTYKISELTSYIQSTIQKQFSTRIWVEGEIMQISKTATGSYITLADKDQESSPKRQKPHEMTAIVWKNTLLHMEQKHQKKVVHDVLQEGLKVRVSCQVSFYKQRAQVNLEVYDIDPSHTKGALALEREKTIAKLKKLQLIDKNKQHHIPAIPLKIGLITGKNSRAESDFLDQIKDAPVGIHIYVLHSAMQGEKTKPQVLSCLNQLQQKDLDAIVLTRGGGSSGDLRWFDSFEIAQAIALSKTPIISAIGHHDDYSIAEMVSFKHEKTPTAAAEYLIQKQALFLEKISQGLHALRSSLDQIIIRTQKKHAELSRKLSESATSKINQNQQQLIHSGHQINRYMEQILSKKSQEIQNKKETINKLILQKINEKEKVLINQLGNLKSLDPTPWLNKGWTQLFGSKSHRIKSINDAKVGESIKAQMQDGQLTLEIISKEKK